MSENFRIRPKNILGTKTLRNSATTIARALHRFFFSEADTPNHRKQPQTTPIIRTGDIEYPHHYKPISVTAALS